MAVLTDHLMNYWIEDICICHTWHKMCYFRDILPSQSLG